MTTTTTPRRHRTCRETNLFDSFLDRTGDPLGFEAGDTNVYRYVGNSPTNDTDPSGLQSKGGKQNIRVTGVPKDVTVKQLQKIIADAEKSGASKAHLKALRGQLKVLKRNVKYRGGFANVRVIAAKAGTILIVAEVTSIVNHGFDYVKLQKIGQQTNEDGSVTATYFGCKIEKTGFLGFGKEKQTGALIYILTVPKERIDRDGVPPDKMNPKLYNLTANSDLLKEMGITEEWVELPEGINTVDQLLDKGNSVIPVGR